MGGRGLVWTTPARRPLDISRHRARLASPHGARSTRTSRGERPRHRRGMVESGAHRAIRDGTDESQPRRACAKRVQQLRDDSARISDARVSLRFRSAVLLPVADAFVTLISDRLLTVVRCPDCHGQLKGEPRVLTCEGCGRRFEQGTTDYLVLRPSSVYDETTKFTEDSFHADGRDESIAPPLLSAAVRNNMLRTFLKPGPGDVVLDLGCGSGRFAMWNRDSGAHFIGVDTGTFFAAESRASLDLVVGELRKLPFADGGVTKAYAIDVVEHLSPESLDAMLGEINRVLAPGGALFVYTHVMQLSPLAPVLG